jgi:hypothetical protein
MKGKKKTVQLGRESNRKTETSKDQITDELSHFNRYSKSRSHIHREISAGILADKRSPNGKWIFRL